VDEGELVVWAQELVGLGIYRVDVDPLREELLASLPPEPVSEWSVREDVSTDMRRFLLPNFRH